MEFAQPLLAAAFTLWGSPTSWAELCGFVCALGMTVCNIRVIVFGWPLAIASSLFYMLVYADGRVYGQMALQLLFITVAAWGWWQWLRGTGDDGRAITVRWLPPRHRVPVLAATLAAWPAMAWWLANFTDTDVPWLDAFPTTLSITASLLLARKYADNWPLWIAVNLVSIALFSVKQWWLTVLLYAIFTLTAAIGWHAWTRRARLARTAAAPSAAPRPATPSA